MDVECQEPFIPASLMIPAGTKFAGQSSDVPSDVRSKESFVEPESASQHGAGSTRRPARPTRQARAVHEASQLFCDNLLQDVAVQTGSATGRFSLPFSSRSWRSSRSSLRPRPTYFLFAMTLLRHLQALLSTFREHRTKTLNLPLVQFLGFGSLAQNFGNARRDLLAPIIVPK